MLTELIIKSFVFDWFKMLDNHVDVSDVVSVLSNDKLMMNFPEATYTSIDGFIEWYNKVTNCFFDEIHDLKMIDIVINCDEATINLIVNWQTKTWEPPAAKSIWMGYDCYQKWIVTKANDKIVIKEYIVEKLVPMLGFPEL